MPRRNLLTSAERIALLAFPLTEDEMIRHYTLSEADLAVIRQYRGGQNRIGFAVQLCVLRYPGCALSPDAQAPEALLAFVARQLRVDPELWAQYAQRAETRRERLLELQAWLALTPFSASHFHHFVERLMDLARQPERGMVLANTLLEALKHGNYSALYAPTDSVAVTNRLYVVASKLFNSRFCVHLHAIAV